MYTLIPMFLMLEVPLKLESPEAAPLACVNLFLGNQSFKLFFFKFGKQ
jgi:hypothetical protein